ncbi:hypothetical protein EDC94DRAFT_691370 [Helicostylum pulchrum]|nr:hypothetical protein EDC94DRAFT_691370 [Helicostylum pulchrum]
MSTENNTFTVWAGVGARIVSCRQCEFCLNSQENMCQVGVLGIGDLGHYGIQFAKSFGAKLIGISHNAMSKYQNQSTHILCAGKSSDFECLPGWKFPNIDTDDIFLRNIKISRSILGSRSDIEGILLFAEKNNIVTWTTAYKMSDVNKALKDFKAGKAQFRLVLEN